MGKYFKETSYRDFLETFLIYSVRVLCVLRDVGIQIRKQT